MDVGFRYFDTLFSGYELNKMPDNTTNNNTTQGNATMGNSTATNTISTPAATVNFSQTQIIGTNAAQNLSAPAPLVAYQRNGTSGNGTMLPNTNGTLGNSTIPPNTNGTLGNGTMPPNTNGTLGNVSMPPNTNRTTFSKILNVLSVLFKGKADEDESQVIMHIKAPCTSKQHHIKGPPV